MATKFEEIYCLNTVIKNDQRLVDKPSYELYNLYWKYLQFAIPTFEFECRKNLYDLVPFSLTEYSFTGDGENNIFELTSVPEDLVDPSFYIALQTDCNSEPRIVEDYTWDSKNNAIILTSVTPTQGELVTINLYEIGQFNSDLTYIEKTILAKAMNIPYYEEQITNSKILNFAVYGGSVKMHSQAEHIKTLEAAFRTAKREVEGDISRYAYNTAPVGLPGLGARTVCLHPLRYKPKPTASE